MAQEYTFATFDGTELYGKTDAVDDPRAVAVLVHGLCEHQGRYDYLAMRLNARGYSVYRFDHRGHGRSAGRRVYYDTFDCIAKDVDAAVDRAAAENPGAPLFVVGHSMGGYGAALHATMFPGKARGYVLSGAWTRDVKGLCSAAVASDARDCEYVDNGLAGGVCSDPAVARRYWEDPYVEKAVSLGLFRAVHEGHQWLKAHAPQCTSPVAVLHGGADGLVDPRDSIEFFQEIGSEDKSLHIYAGLCHEIFNEFDKDLVIGDMLAWLDARASGRGFGPDPFDEAVLEA